MSHNQNINIFFRWNHCMLLDINRVTRSTSQFVDYIDNQFVCNQKQLQNESIFAFSVFIAFLSSLTICIVLIAVIKKLIVFCCKKFNYEFISHKPSYFVLIYSVLTDIIIYIAMFWWLIKSAMFYPEAKQYCSEKYKYEEDNQFCVNDKICNYNYELGNYKCEAAETIWIIFITWLVSFVIVMLIEIVNIYVSYYSENDIFCLPDCIICWKYFRVKSFAEQYENRTMWIPCAALCFDECNLLGHLIVYLYRYLIYVILAWITVLLYGKDNNDYSIKWYEFYMILILILIKSGIQIGYTYSPKYKVHDEIKAILQEKFGEQISHIIRVYLPLFHDESKCSSSVLVTEQEMAKFGYKNEEKGSLIELHCTNEEGQ
eukprot:463236_1